MINAIILSAGKGTRMKSELPKCAFPILKKPMIKYILDTLDNVKIDNRVIVVGYKKEVFFEMLPNETFAIQEEQLGTADAVKSAIKYLKDGVSIILPGDTPLFDYNVINEIIDSHLNAKKDITLCTTILDNPFGYGRIVRENGLVKRIVEEKDASSDIKKIKEVNTGIMVINNDYLKDAINKIDNKNAKGEYYLTDIVNFTDKINSYTLKENLYGINDVYLLKVVEDKIINDNLEYHLKNGVNIINPKTVTIGPNVYIAEGVTIYPNSVIFNSKIEENAVIGPNTELNNATILEGAKVVHSLVSDSTIGKNATVGPFAHIRMNSVIGEKDRIGNFVEVKNSTLGFNTKSSHLAYIGDSDFGNNINFGCGSITVNYDGKKKSRTVVGDNVFVGCNSNLIAPIKIDDNAFIAAGSTITDDVEKDDLAIARSRQVNKKGYAKKYK